MKLFSNAINADIDFYVFIRRNILILISFAGRTNKMAVVEEETIKVATVPTIQDIVVTATAMEVAVAAVGAMGVAAVAEDVMEVIEIIRQMEIN